MAIQILSAFPNAFLPTEGNTLTLRGISETEAIAIASENEVMSFVGHTSTSQLFTERLGVKIRAFRGEATPAKASLIGSFTPPRRLAEGEAWSEGEILSMPIKWLLIG